MKQLLRTFTFIFLLNGLNAQTKMNLITSVNLNPMNLDSKIFYSMNFGVGFKIYERYEIESKFDYLISSMKGYNQPRLVLAMNSYSFSYRILNQHRLSPIIDFELGYQLFSNGKNELISSNLVLSNEQYNSTIGYFRRFGLFYSLKVGLAFEQNKITWVLNIGPRVQNYSYNVINNPEIVIRSTLVGGEINAGVTYRINSK